MFVLRTLFKALSSRKKAILLYGKINVEVTTMTLSQLQVKISLQVVFQEDHKAYLYFQKTVKEAISQKLFSELLFFMKEKTVASFPNIFDQRTS